MEKNIDVARVPRARFGIAGSSSWSRAVTSRRGLLLGGGWMGAAGVALPLALAACSSSPSKGSVAPSQSSKPVTLTYFTDWNGGTRADWVNSALPKFTLENPGISVQPEFAQGDAKVAALANAAAGTLSDVLLGGGDIPHNLARSGALVELTPVLKAQKFKMDDVVWIPSTIQVKGKQYGLPFQWNYWTRVINKTMFKTAGVPLPTEKTTWPDLADSLQKIAKPDQDVWGIETGNSIWYWFPNVWAYGGEVITVDQKKTVVDQPASLDGLQQYVDMILRQRIGTPMDEKGGIPSSAKFVNGNVAIAHANAPGKGLDTQIAGKFEWDVMYLPLGPKTGKRNVFVSEQPNIVTTSAQKHSVVDQAVRLIVWMCSSKTAQDMILDVGTNSWPTAKATLNSTKYLAGPPESTKVMVDMIKDFKDPQIFQGWLDWRAEVSNALNPAFAGKQSVQVAAKEAVRAGDVVLQKNA